MFAHLDLEEGGSEELPLPGAGQEDPHTVRGRLPGQTAPLLCQTDLQLLPLLGGEVDLVAGGVELGESLHHRALVWPRVPASSLTPDVSQVDLKIFISFFFYLALNALPPPPILPPSNIFNVNN